MRAHYLADGFSTFTYGVISALLGVYIFSIVFGRLYAGMHSFTDCVAGVALGSAIFVVQGYFYPILEKWIVSAPLSGSAWSNWLVPGFISLTAGIMVHRHPQPAEDCPCFEEAIAFLSVVAEILIAQ